jgi:ubiquitin carboxyl-terminal hydrolase 12/46
MGNEPSSILLEKLGPHFPDSVKFMKIPNIGNTCYANALIQALFNSTYFIAWLEAISRPLGFACTSTDVQTSLLVQLLSIYRSLKLSKSREFVARPKLFLDAVVQTCPDLRIGTQHDAHELFMLMLSSFDATIESINSGKPDPLPLFSKLFSCHSITSSQCLMCGYILESLDDFTSFYLSIEQRQSLVARLRSAQSYEYLHGPGKRDCRHCRIPQEMKIQCQYVHLPEIALFQLQRFEVNRYTNQTRKLSQVVPFPSMLTLNETQYELRSVVVHIGPELTSGHFVAILRINEKWILANDERLSLLKNDQVEEFFLSGEDPAASCSTAYLLFYEMIKE